MPAIGPQKTCYLTRSSTKLPPAIGLCIFNLFLNETYVGYWTTYALLYPVLNKTYAGHWTTVYINFVLNETLAGYWTPV